jgi:hypothetical protein
MIACLILIAVGCSSQEDVESSRHTKKTRTHIEKRLLQFEKENATTVREDCFSGEKYSFIPFGGIDIEHKGKAKLFFFLTDTDGKNRKNGILFEYLSTSEWLNISKAARVKLITDGDVKFYPIETYSKSEISGIKYESAWIRMPYEEIFQLGKHTRVAVELSLAGQADMHFDISKEDRVKILDYLEKR